MTAIDQQREAIWRAYDALPEKTRAEIIDGEIIVRPAPSNADQLAKMYLNRLMLTEVSGVRWVDLSGGVILERGWDVYLPALLVGPEDAWPPDELGPIASKLELVAEVTSPSRRDAARNREIKSAAYARAGIPLYLLVNRYDGDGYATLFSNPASGQYQSRHGVPFGEKLTLPKPFEVDVDTAQF
jgi:Uma2 family endonuclease